MQDARRDVTKSELAQKTNFGAGRPALSQNRKGHQKCRIILTVQALFLLDSKNKAGINHLLSGLGKTTVVSLKALCHSFHQCHKLRRRR